MVVGAVASLDWEAMRGEHSNSAPPLPRFPREDWRIEAGKERKRSGLRGVRLLPFILCDPCATFTKSRCSTVRA